MCIEDDAVKHRVFIVGSPRSGTTLLQGMLGMHPRIRTFPETHFFDRAFPTNFIKQWVAWPALNVQGVMEQFMREIGRDDLVGEANIGLFTPNYGAKFVSLLDRVTVESGMDIWVEKTPRHLHFIEEIKEQVPGSRFLHIIRRGVDVVASLHEITNRDPKAWTKGRRPGFKGFSIDECIRLWNQDIRVTGQYRHNPRHVIVCYESLIEDPEPSLRRITDFLAIRFVPDMLRPEKIFGEIVGSSEPWKAANAKPLHKPVSKFEQMFSKETQCYIRDRLIQPDL